MLTRLKVKGFKNLLDVDVRFGPFTCIAGPNATGKSNLFDAIHFLSLLAEHRLIDAATKIRESGGGNDIDSIFYRSGGYQAKEMSFEVEMIIPQDGEDELGFQAFGSTSFLKYFLRLGNRSSTDLTVGPMEILQEELTYIPIQEAPANLLFPHVPKWRKSVINGSRRTPFISTEDTGGETIIKLHQDQSKGKPYSRAARNLPRTVISSANTAEFPTVMLARKEMLTWQSLQLEPAALRRHDDFTEANAPIGVHGQHLPATLLRIRNEEGDSIYSEVGNRLSELIDDVFDVRVDQDEVRKILVLMVAGKDGTAYPASALSDGTLRFLALTVLNLDYTVGGLICFEEPENGIHPKRIPAILELIQEMAVDPEEEVSEDNPLRQIIINTHSPAVVTQVDPDDLLVAESREVIHEGKRLKGVSFSAIPETWRQKDATTRLVSLNKLLDYLNPAHINYVLADQKIHVLDERKDKKKKSLKNHPVVRNLFSAPHEE